MTEIARSNGSCLLRLVWFGIGPVMMLILAMINMDRGGGWLTTVDVSYFIALGTTIAARILDFRSGRAKTAAGVPATQAHLQRYVPGVLLVALAVWAITNAIGN
jgi:hypothetical protein